MSEYINPEHADHVYFHVTTPKGIEIVVVKFDEPAEGPTETLRTHLRWHVGHAPERLMRPHETPPAGGELRFTGEEWADPSKLETEARVLWIQARMFASRMFGAYIEGSGDVRDDIEDHTLRRYFPASAKGDGAPGVERVG